MFGVRQKEDVTAASPALLKNLARLYAKETGRVGVQAQMEIRSGMPLCLTLSDPDGNSILVSGAVPEAARSKETTEEMVRQSLSKLGGTPYYLKSEYLVGRRTGGSGVGAQPSPAGSSGKALSQKKPSKNNSFFLLRR